ncbi:hypothetical protein Sj15T_31490 [Sphingobium sp. TA15]|uniref:Uncharacterized protein n=3 Tax=Sphingomonadaceae TaxID=41297 RepID=D4Z976_SPHIU|nr:MULTISPECIES: hypothetical protein [Sphingomonadaceae]BDD68128.1 hypothetical protein Sj15T_31490 [Sphingobium sp. TA15]EQB07341.1 hypothetical protein L286_04040 [Sphingobium sp. HDIP04]EQB33750.1 hypothetical protein M529_01730 [Sphingobium ummariense RL-3]MBB4046991.1 hypothetical protein [Sphingomonas zeae]NUU49096.1 hypothetical protein [Sphingomonas zeae]
MSDYIVKIGFWLRAYDTLTVQAASDAEAIEKAKTAAAVVVESTASPDHIDTDERREGVIAFIDRCTGDGRETVIEDIEFDDDRIHRPPAA